MDYWLIGQTLSKGLDVGHIQIQTTFYKIRVKKCSLFLASSAFFKYAFKKYKIFMGEGMGACPQTPLACSDRFAVLTGDTWATRFLNLWAQMVTAYKS